MPNPTLTLKNFAFQELFTSDGLSRLDQAYQQFLSQKNSDLFKTFIDFRTKSKPFSNIQKSDLLIRCAIILEDFIADLFSIEESIAISQQQTTALNPLSAFKKYFVLRRAKKELGKLKNFFPFQELNDWLEGELKKAGLTSNDKELAVALLAQKYLADPLKHAVEIENLVQWCTHALYTSEAKAKVSSWVSFRIPERLDYQQLVNTVVLEDDKHKRMVAPQLRLRDGFKLTDPRMSARDVQDEVNYCIFCHDHEGDFCSKGFPVKKSDPIKVFKKNPLDLTLTGCPLEEKISEMHLLKRDGYTVAALAMVMIDNPMCPATGHRICNECMKACIYQKQEPVNIPQIETRVLMDVLHLPWGVEIYDLLTRWNPLREQQWMMKPYNGLKVMIAGQGPAGFTLAHHLLLEGFAVVAFDGLKIEPLPTHLLNQPIYCFNDLKESLDERIMAGFGGVAEYGITVRWDKNFLKLIYLSLMRRPFFQVFGSTRLGGTIIVEDAWEMGFDHFVVAVGAGLPKALLIPNSLGIGMRQANDFLMALQLGNAAKANSLTNLQIRLPAVVIGGGLTGVDTATELQGYYITQVEKVRERYEILVKEYGEDYITQELDSASREILSEYLRHADEIRKERDRAKLNDEQPNFINLVRAWGGVTIAYRRMMQDSPAYQNNHEELQKALNEGIYYLESLEPISVTLNDSGHTEALICHKRIRNEKNEWVATTEEIRLPARSILVATGTQPNTAYEFEHRGTFNRLNLQYQHYENKENQLVVAHGVSHCKDPQFGPFTSYHKDHYRVSLVGDTHPVFHGSVVKAIASGMRTYPKILDILQSKMGRGDQSEYQKFAADMDDLFKAQVVNVTRMTKEIIEMTIHAPIALKHFKPGQFYRLQNFETLAQSSQHTMLQMEPLALVPADWNVKLGTLTFIVRENIPAAKLCATLKPGEPISLMGPTGVRAKIPSEHETVLIVGDQSSFAFVRSYGKELRKAKNHVIYVCQLKDKEELYCQQKLEEATDVIIWLTEKGDTIGITRSADYSISGFDVMNVLAEYSAENSSVKKNNILLSDVDRIFVVGNTNLLRQFQLARTDVLKECFVKNPKVFGSVYGNMQCMLKGVCAQCLQWQIDPETGQRTKAVFACSWQDQPLEIIDIDHIDARISQNHLLEHLSNLWIDHLFAKHSVERV